MAIGDDAAAAGMDVINPATHDLRDGGTEINKTRDYVAQHQTGGTHPASAIASGTLDAARIPTLPASKIGSGTLDVARLPTVPLSKMSFAGGTAGFDAIVVGGAGFAIDSGGNLYTPAGRGTPVVTSYVAAYLNGDGRLGATPSSKRFKTHLGVFEVPDDFLDLEPVVFYYNDDPLRTPRIGFYAEDVNKIAPVLVVHDRPMRKDGTPDMRYNPIPFTVRYEQWGVVLHAIMRNWRNRLNTIEARLSALEQKGA